MTKYISFCIFFRYYNFSRSHHLSGTDDEMSFHRQTVNRTVVPLVLEWAMTTDGACLSTNSSRANDTSDGGRYLCKCDHGYAGNPYIVGGCSPTSKCCIYTSTSQITSLYFFLFGCVFVHHRRLYIGTDIDEQYRVPSGTRCNNGTDGSYDYTKCKFGRFGSECRPVFSAKAAAVSGRYYIYVSKTSITCN